MCHSVNCVSSYLNLARKFPVQGTQINMTVLFIEMFPSNIVAVEQLQKSLRWRDREPHFSQVHCQTAVSCYQISMIHLASTPDRPSVQLFLEARMAETNKQRLPFDGHIMLHSNTLVTAQSHRFSAQENTTPQNQNAKTCCTR